MYNRFTKAKLGMIKSLKSALFLCVCVISCLSVKAVNQPCCCDELITNPFVLSLQDKYCPKDGSLDTNFGNFNGILYLDNTVLPLNTNVDDMDIQKDGKIVAAIGANLNTGPTGTSYLTIVRYNIDGSLDKTFNGSGIFQMSIGNPTLVGPRPIFDKGSIDVFIQKDGKIITGGIGSAPILGNVVYVIRLNSNGTLDTTFGQNGQAIINFPNNAQITDIRFGLSNNDEIIVASKVNVSLFGITKLTKDGQIDRNFAKNGSDLIPISTSISVFPISVDFQCDDKILINLAIQLGTALTTFRPAILRYNINGTLDSTFNPNGPTPGILIDDLGIASDQFPWGLALQCDGKIIMDLNLAFARIGAVVRYNSNGSRDITFGNNGIVQLTSNLPESEGGIDIHASIAIQPDGKIIVPANQLATSTHQRRPSIIRLNTDGSIDTNFGNNGISVVNFDAIVAADPSVAPGRAFPNQAPAFVQCDNKILIGGFVGTLTESVFKGFIFRLNNKVTTDGVCCTLPYCCGGVANPNAETNAFVKMLEEKYCNNNN